MVSVQIFVLIAVLFLLFCWNERFLLRFWSHNDFTLCKCGVILMFLLNFISGACELGLGVNYNYLFSVLIVVFGTCRYEIVLLFWLLTVFSALPSISYLLHCLIYDVSVLLISLVTFLVLVLLFSGFAYIFTNFGLL